VSDTWEPYARAPESTVVGELLAHRGLDRELLALLPASYGGGAGRYPVLYAHDGQNLFDETTSHSGEWRVDETMASLAGEGIEAIVVGIANESDARASEYSPWAQEPHVEHGRADEYLDVVLGAVKPLVDRSFRTLPGRETTGMLGSSLGALVSLYAFFSRPGRVGFAGALSTAFFGGEEAFAFFEEAPFVEGRIWLDVGDREAPDRTDVNAWYVEGFERMAALLERKGYGPDRLSAAVVPGGLHIESAWAERFPDAMRFWLGR
jgi:predicted alpha/beta superfamily hydrolase